MGVSFEVDEKSGVSEAEELLWRVLESRLCTRGRA